LDNYGADLPTILKRANKNDESTAERVIKDVVDGVKLIDAKYPDKDVHLPIVLMATTNLSKLPNLTPDPDHRINGFEEIISLSYNLLSV